MYTYDVVSGKQEDPRRTKFNKELYGYRYKWETKTGLKQSRKPGLLTTKNGRKVADSVILVSNDYEMEFDDFFERYSDVVDVYKFKVTD
ncbi:MAG: hypothetical protein ACFE7E_02910 [Candidatus Hodarchaeota archaeon]